MKIEAGKFYASRDNRRVRIYATDGMSERPIHGAVLFNNGWIVCSWARKGTFARDESERCPDDIISEWIDRLEMDWSALPRWAKWIAMDECRDWAWFADKPRSESREWYSGGKCGVMPVEYAPKWSGDWKDSLTAVPKRALE